MDPIALKEHRFPAVRFNLAAREAILYALGIGVGLGPAADEELDYVYEPRLRIFPTLLATLGTNGDWLKEPAFDIQWQHVVHGEHSLVVHRQPAAGSELTARLSIDDVVDKGTGRGALIYARIQIYEASSNELVATSTSVSFCRQDGGCGSTGERTAVTRSVPARKPDTVLDLPISPQAALIYRLSGDYNPLHVDPEAARLAGFPRPILHGLAAFGMAGRAIVRQACDGDETRLKSLALRFSAPAYPGETLRTEIWREEAGRIAFRCRAVERNVVVIENGGGEIAR